MLGMIHNAIQAAAHNPVLVLAAFGGLCVGLFALVRKAFFDVLLATWMFWGPAAASVALCINDTGGLGREIGRGFVPAAVCLAAVVIKFRHAQKDWEPHLAVLVAMAWSIIGIDVMANTAREFWIVVAYGVAILLSLFLVARGLISLLREAQKEAWVTFGTAISVFAALWFLRGQAGAGMHWGTVVGFLVSLIIALPAYFFVGPDLAFRAIKLRLHDRFGPLRWRTISGSHGANILMTMQEAEDPEFLGGGGGTVIGSYAEEGVVAWLKEGINAKR